MKLIFEIDFSQVPADKTPALKGRVKPLFEYMQRAFLREAMLLDLDHPSVQVGWDLEDDPEIAE